MPFEYVLLPDSKTETSISISEENTAMDTGDVSPKRKNRKKYRNPCCVCSSNSSANGISYHKLPTDKKLLKLWKIKCRLSDKTPSTSSVCSRHFVASDYGGGEYRYNEGNKRLLRNAVPSQNLPVPSYARRKNVAQMESRAHRLLNRNSKQATVVPKVVVPCVDKTNATKFDIKLPPKKITSSSKSTNAVPRKVPNVSIKKKVKPIATVVPAKTENITSTIGNATSLSSSVNVMDFLNLKSRTKLQAWTGLRTFSLLGKIEERITLMHPKVFNGSDLSLLECILLCFIKQKTKLPVVCLTSLFHLTSTSVAKIFQSMLPYIRKALNDVDYFSSTIESKDNQPITLRMYGYNEARAIVDCVERDVPNSKRNCSNKIEQSLILEGKDSLPEIKPILKDLCCTPKSEFEFKAERSE